jgi:hypothetical protein
MQIEVAIIISIIGCAVCALQAHEKNRSVPAWAIGGFLLPVIITIAALCVRALPAPEES